MKTIIMSIVLSLFLMVGIHNQSYAQRYRDNRGNIRAHITIGTPNVQVHYGNYRPYGYRHTYYRAGYVAPTRVYYRYHRAYPADRYWVSGYWDEWGNWIPGHWEWY